MFVLLARGASILHILPHPPLRKVLMHHTAGTHSLSTITSKAQGRFFCLPHTASWANLTNTRDHKTALPQTLSQERKFPNQGTRKGEDSLATR